MRGALSIDRPCLQSSACHCLIIHVRLYYADREDRARGGFISAQSLRPLKAQNSIECLHTGLTLPALKQGGGGAGLEYFRDSNTFEEGEKALGD